MGAWVGACLHSCPYFGGSCPFSITVLYLWLSEFVSQSNTQHSQAVPKPGCQDQRPVCCPLLDWGMPSPPPCPLVCCPLLDWGMPSPPPTMRCPLLDWGMPPPPCAALYWTEVCPPPPMCCPLLDWGMPSPPPPSVLPSIGLRYAIPPPPCPLVCCCLLDWGMPSPPPTMCCPLLDWGMPPPPPCAALYWTEVRPPPPTCFSMWKLVHHFLGCVRLTLFLFVHATGGVCYLM